MSLIAVIDTETNWQDAVMSIGVVTASGITYRPIQERYYILTPEFLSEGMYSDRLELTDPAKTRVLSRKAAMEDLKSFLRGENVEKIFAYNARFDCHHMPELRSFLWYDIMKIAAYRQYNDRISCCSEFCTTGRLKRNYGVEPILRCLRNDPSYCETHNALLDARDELQIMELLRKPLSLYEQCAKV